MASAVWAYAAPFAITSRAAAGQLSPLTATLPSKMLFRYLVQEPDNPAGIVPIADGCVVDRGSPRQQRILRVDGQPHADILHHVVAHRHVARALVQVERNAAGNVADVIFGDQRSGIGRQVIDCSAVGVPLLHA